jgi:hypothetical protein
MNRELLEIPPENSRIQPIIHPVTMPIVILAGIIAATEVTILSLKEITLSDTLNPNSLKPGSLLTVFFTNGVMRI